MFRPRKLPGGKEIWNKTKQTIQSIFLKFLERKGMETNGKIYLDMSRTFQVKLNEDCKCQFDQKRRPVCVFWRMSICRDWYWMILPHINLCPPSSIIILIVREGLMEALRPDQTSLLFPVLWYLMSANFGESVIIAVVCGKHHWAESLHEKDNAYSIASIVSHANARSKLC